MPTISHSSGSSIRRSAQPVPDIHLAPRITLNSSEFVVATNILIAIFGVLLLRQHSDQNICESQDQISLYYRGKSTFYNATCKHRQQALRFNVLYSHLLHFVIEAMRGRAERLYPRRRSFRPPHPTWHFHLHYSSFFLPFVQHCSHTSSDPCFDHQY